MFDYQFVPRGLGEDLYSEELWMIKMLSLQRSPKRIEGHFQGKQGQTEVIPSRVEAINKESEESLWSGVR